MENNLTNPNENGNEQTVDVKDLEAKIKSLEAENGKLKQSVTKASADASDWKHKFQEKDELLKSKMSDEEKAKAEHDAAYAAMQEKVATLEARERIANFTAALGASDIGMDAETAKYVAEALHSGETDKVFDGIRKFISTHDKAIAEKAMLNNPTLPGGNSSPRVATKDEFMNMGLEQMQAFHDEHPDLYKEYMNKT